MENKNGSNIFPLGIPGGHNFRVAPGRVGPGRVRRGRDPPRAGSGRVSRFFIRAGPGRVWVRWSMATTMVVGRAKPKKTPKNFIMTFRVRGLKSVRGLS